MAKRSELLTQTIGVIYPIIFIFGIYIIVNGHKTPGGGFQGGVMLASIFIVQYIIDPIDHMPFKNIIKLEKILFFCIILYPIIFIFNSGITHNALSNEIYLITMNSLIAIKVSCGFSIIFFRFVLFESR